jgi:hypothetical protein
LKNPKTDVARREPLEGELTTMSCHRAGDPQQPGLPNERMKFHGLLDG